MKLKLLWSFIFQRPARTLLVLLMIVLGTSSLIIYDSFIAGLLEAYKQQTVRAHYGHGQIYQAGYFGKHFDEPTSQWIKAPDPLLERLRSSPGVLDAFPRVEFPALLSAGDTSAFGRGVGVDGTRESKFFDQLNIIEGENITSRDKGLVIGVGMARALAVKLGDTVTLTTQTPQGSLNAIVLKVTGIFHFGAKDFDDGFFRVGIESAQSLMATTSIEGVTIALRDETSWPTLLQNLKQSNPELEAIPFNELDRVIYQNAVDWLSSQASLIKWILIAIVVLGISGLLSFGFLERRREYASLRANGYEKKRIFGLILAEASLLGALGGLAGLIMGIILVKGVLINGVPMPPAPGFTRGLHVYLLPSSAMGAAALFTGLATSLAASAATAWSLARMKMSEGLRAT